MTKPDPIAPATLGAADPNRFCAGYAQAAGTPLAGIGAHQERTLWLRWPKGRWRHSLRIADGMEGAVADGLEAVFAGGRRVNLIDRKDDVDDTVRALLFPENIGIDVVPKDLPDVLAAIAAGDEFGRFGPRPLETQTVFVCTHGVHDRCCAKWGFAAYKALAAAAGDRFDVWECTHLGGCRIAAGALVLPVRRKYGRITPIHAALLLAAEAEDRPYLPCYRGASSLDPIAQVAEVAGLRALAEIGIWGTADVTILASPEDTPRFNVEVAERCAEVTLARGEVADHGACVDLHSGQAPETRTVWRATEVILRSQPSPASTT